MLYKLTETDIEKSSTTRSLTLFESSILLKQAKSTLVSI